MRIIGYSWSIKSDHFSDSGFPYVDVHKCPNIRTPETRTILICAVLTGRKRARVDNLICFLHMGVLVRAVERRTGESHETSPCRFQNAEGSNEL